MELFDVAIVVQHSKNDSSESDIPELLPCPFFAKVSAAVAILANFAVFEDTD